MAVAWADAILAGGNDITDELRTRVRSVFAPDEVVEITYAIGTFIGYAKQIITLGMEPASLPITVVPTPGVSH